MERFGSDRPDLRYGLELKDLADLADTTEFKVFKQAKEFGHRIRGICAPGGGERYSRKDLDGLTEFAGVVRGQGAGLAQGRGRGVHRPDRQVLPQAEVQAELRERFGAKAGDLILIVADTQAVTSQALSNLRARLAAELKLYDPKAFHYSWIIHFPLLAWDAEEGRYVAEHHPFTMPMFEDLPLLDTDPAKVRAQAYDLVDQRRGGRRRHDPLPRPGRSSPRSSPCWA